MQLRFGFFILSLLALPVFAQDSAKVHLEDVEVNFLMSYYQQDGNHSPVTGGIGTEKLNNIAPGVTIKVPLDSVNTLTVDGGVDFYSSASSDNISNPFGDLNQATGASAKDERTYVNFGLKRKKKVKHFENSYKFGISNEWDVFSFTGSYGLSKSTKSENQSFDFNLKYYFDNWKLIYPVELRQNNIQWLPTNKRHTLDLSLTGSTVLNKRMQMSLTSNVVMQNGLLSTPFHRVYFQDSINATIERLPALRIKFPVGVRFNYYMNDYVRVRTFYRFYVDTWGVLANTAKVELPVRIHQALSIIPFYRYHQQSATRYFGEFGTALPTDEFYTSDFDLSALTTQKFGIGISIHPLFGLGRFKGLFRRDEVSMFKTLDLRYAYYMRSDGLKAHSISMGMKFTIPNK